MTRTHESLEEMAGLVRKELASALAQAEVLKGALRVAILQSDDLEKRNAVLGETIVLKDALVLALTRSEALTELLKVAVARAGGLERKNVLMVETITSELVTHVEAIDLLRQRVEVLEDR
jgi:hypothetical protein